MRLLLSAALIAFASVTLAHAEKPHKVSKGKFGGAELAETGKKIAGTSIKYTDKVYADPNNPFCAGCLDFVIQVDDPTTAEGVTSVSTTGFSGYLLDFGYKAEDGGVKPVNEKTNKSGNKVTFDLDLFDTDSDPLIIYTDALSYATGGLTINAETTDPPAFAPSGAPYNVGATPEPSSLILLGSGLFGVVGMIRRRFI
jgi:PEP-CTERM motif